MKILVNGDSREIGENATVADLIAELGLAGKRIAVELNKEILPLPNTQPSGCKPTTGWRSSKPSAAARTIFSRWPANNTARVYWSAPANTRIWKKPG